MNNINKVITKNSLIIVSEHIDIQPEIFHNQLSNNLRFHPEQSLNYDFEYNS